jgi:ribosome-associated protein
MITKTHAIKETLDDTKSLITLLDEKKSVDPIILDVSFETAFCDFFVIASGQSFTHLQSLEQYCEEFLESKGYIKRNPRNSVPENPWILLDFSDIVVHLFIKEAREFYHLENLWFDSRKITLKDL